MRVLITGICGYVGSRVASGLRRSMPGLKLYGMDNLSRRGSESNIPFLARLGVKPAHGDVRLREDIDALPAADWVIDCAANPSVLAGTGVDGCATSEQLVGSNLTGTLNLLEYCKKHRSGLILLSTSRVYSVNALNSLKLRETSTRFEPAGRYPEGFSARGVSEAFSTASPVSLYGATKLSSEIMALEYADAFGFPIRINRAGVIGGPGQFGKADQGIFSFWACARALGAAPKFIGFGGKGKQVRDCVSAEEVAELLAEQIRRPGKKAPRTINIGGGPLGALSLRELDDLCRDFFGAKDRPRGEAATRPYDVPYYVSDTRLAEAHWGWKPSLKREERIAAICRWAADNRDSIRKWWGL
ncbi:MAG TPA: NAD-dependent epimerase/dehydratase family protein [Elusimicrobiales bacterium]|nr:NAD-dependent epimerase/dehydratase family protein [Elusimicrobiales bacterium]